MKNLRMNVGKIKDLIDLKTDNWKFPSSTNCYAYALGLDVPFTKISDHAYKIGCFSEDALKRRNINVFDLDEEKRLFLDLYYLGLSQTEVEPDYVLDNIDKKYSYFLISYFEGFQDFHFLRKNPYDNTWYHKVGYFAFPKNRDDDRQKIYNPKEAFFINYFYVKTLKVGFKNKR